MENETPEHPLQPKTGKMVAQEEGDKAVSPTDLCEEKEKLRV